MPLGKHCGANIIRFEDEHPLFSVPFPDDLAVFDEAAMVSESDLHSLFNDLSNQHWVLGYRRDMQDVPPKAFLADMALGDVSNVLDGMRGVVPSFDDPWLFRLL